MRARDVDFATRWEGVVCPFEERGQPIPRDLWLAYRAIDWILRYCERRAWARA